MESGRHQTQLRSALVAAFQLSDADVVDFPTFLQVHFDDLTKKLTPDSILQFETIIASMRNIESFLSGMMAGYSAYAESLGSYSGLIYDRSADCPVGGESDDCDMIIVAKSGSSFTIEHLGNMAGKIMHFFDLDSGDSKSLGLSGDVTVTSLCHS